MLLAVTLAGCTTTRDVNERFELRAERILAGREPVKVTTQNPDVAVRRVDVIRDRGGAVVVELENLTDQPLSDLPISVGVETPKKGRELLNDRGGINYYQARVAALAPSASARWVFSTRKPIPKGEPFAIVGDATEPRPERIEELPTLKAAPASAPSALRAVITNSSDIPQYNLPVYATARSGDRYVAAGRANIEELAQRSHSTIDIHLAGDPATAPVELEALPTIFR